MAGIIDLSPFYNWINSLGIPQFFQSIGLSQWISYFANIIIQSQFFQQYGLLVMFLWEASPIFMIPIPLVVFMAPMLAVGINPYDIFLIAVAGSVVGGLVFYFIAKYTTLKFAKHEVSEIEESHFLHSKHRWWIFALAPMFFLTGDGLMVYAGAKRMPIQKFIIPLFIGNMVRILIDLLVSMGLLQLPKLFGS